MTETKRLIDEKALIAAADACADITSFGVAREIVRAYEKAKYGRHYHVAHTESDKCAGCGFDLRDEIHKRVGE